MPSPVRLLPGLRPPERPDVQRGVIVQDAVHASVHSVVRPVLLRPLGALAAAVPEDARGQAARGFREVAPGFRDDRDPAPRREVGFEGAVDRGRGAREGEAAAHGEAAADVEDGHGRQAQGLGQVEDAARGADRVGVRAGAPSAAAHVERDACDQGTRLSVVRSNT